jgi:periplasmic divalent cation tolerance protein
VRAARRFSLVLSTVGNEPDAVRISRALVESKLAACVNIVPKIRSIYRWEGKVHDDHEVLLIVKTSGKNLNEVERTIRKLHKYDVPEILSVRPEMGSDRYLRWLSMETTQKRRK